jgi:preprotein translocase subunit SecY
LQMSTSPITGCSATSMQKVLVVLQLTLATYIIMLLDQMLQEGWGLGSAISLFILAGVANHMFWQLFGINPIGGLHPGLIPFLFQSRDIRAALMRPGRYADIVGLVATITVIVLLVYLQSMKIEIPITTQRLRGIRSRMPLQFIYFTNIPILLVGILVSDLVLFANLAERIGRAGFLADFLRSSANYLQPPGGFYSVLYNISASHYVIYAASWLLLSVVFGFMWVEIAGLSPSAQAEQLIKSGMEVPGIRRNKRILEQRLAKYIYPLTLLSSLIVGAIAVLADTFGAYGTGSGILLAVGILQQYYMMIAYERTLEAYPFLKRLIGE